MSAGKVKQMLELQIPKSKREELFRKSPDEKDCLNLITDSCTLRDETGRLRLIYLKNYPLFGLRSEILKMGKFGSSRRQSGVPSRSRVFGFQPRAPVQQRDFCHGASLKRDYPEVANFLENYAAKVTGVMKEMAPERHAICVEATKGINEAYRLKDSVFTSGIVNQDNPLQYHYDGGNFEETFSVMAVMKHKVSGGHLILPEYDVKIECADNSLLIFDGQSELHGVTPIIKTAKDSYRYSIVFYSLKALAKCGTHKEELRRAQISRTKTEMKRASHEKE